jgi:hypothetical protein
MGGFHHRSIHQWVVPPAQQRQGVGRLVVVVWGVGGSAMCAEISTPEGANETLMDRRSIKDKVWGGLIVV